MQQKIDEWIIKDNLTDEDIAYIDILKAKVDLLFAKSHYTISLKKDERDTLKYILDNFVPVVNLLLKSNKTIIKLNELVSILNNELSKYKSDNYFVVYYQINDHFEIIRVFKDHEEASRFINKRTDSLKETMRKKFTDKEIEELKEKDMSIEEYIVLQFGEYKILDIGSTD